LRAEELRLPGRLAAALEALEAGLPENPLAEPLAGLPLAVWGQRLALFAELLPSPAPAAAAGIEDTGDPPRQALQALGLLLEARPQPARQLASFLATLP